MAPALVPLLRRAVAASTTASVTVNSNSNSNDDGFRGATGLLHARDDDKKPTNTNHVDPSKGVLDPHDISNVGFFVLFALIGLGFVGALIYFFFWARNGGFHFKQTDWEDYKTAVMRRRGPNGTLLSGATPSTNLGGGSVYKDVEDDGKTTVTESTGLSGITAGASDVAAREKREEKRESRRREREQRRREREQEGSQINGARRVGEDGGVLDEEAEKCAKAELRNYRHEKSARVGGLNKQSEGSSWDGSNPTGSSAGGADSELLSNRQSTPTNTPTKKGGIRKVHSTADRNDEREAERIRAEARKLREQGRTARRDFSYQRSTAAATDSLLDGGSAADDGDLGTKSYRHSRPELSGRENGSSGNRDREKERAERRERRERRGGYRRGRDDDL